MPDDPVTARAEIASDALAAVQPGDSALGAVAWWVSGGMALLAWTGIALLLTGA